MDNNKTCKTYYCDISLAEVSNLDLSSFPKERLQYVESISDPLRKKQSILVWKLLQYVFKLNGYINLDFCQKNDKWVAYDSKISFSLSHSFNVVAVSICDNCSVGVDVERCDEKILKLSKKLSTNDSNVDTLTRIWTEKESVYKCGEKYKTYSIFIFDNENYKYCLTTCTNIKCDFINVDLSKL